MSENHKKLMVFKIDSSFFEEISKIYLNKTLTEKNRRLIRARRVGDEVVYYKIQSKNRRFQIYIYRDGKCVFTGRKSILFSSNRFKISLNELIIKDLRIPIKYIRYIDPELIKLLKK
ncbi:MAG: hypothetical protein QXF76_02680 [Candidatus Anstonellales archaeon]